MVQDVVWRMWTTSMTLSHVHNLFYRFIIIRRKCELLQWELGRCRISCGGCGQHQQHCHMFITYFTDSSSSEGSVNYYSGSWDGAGCRVEDVDSINNIVTCSCDHFTDFAILVSPLVERESLCISIITYIGCVLSLVAVVFNITAHFGIR